MTFSQILPSVYKLKYLHTEKKTENIFGLITYFPIKLESMRTANLIHFYQ